MNSVSVTRTLPSCLDVEELGNLDDKEKDVSAACVGTASIDLALAILENTSMWDEYRIHAMCLLGSKLSGEQRNLVFSKILIATRKALNEQTVFLNNRPWLWSGIHFFLLVDHCTTVAGTPLINIFKSSLEQGSRKGFKRIHECQDPLLLKIKGDVIKAIIDSCLKNISDLFFFYQYTSSKLKNEIYPCLLLMRYACKPLCSHLDAAYEADLDKRFDHIEEEILHSIGKQGHATMDLFERFCLDLGVAHSSQEKTNTETRIQIQRVHHLIKSKFKEEDYEKAHIFKNNPLTKYFYKEIRELFPVLTELPLLTNYFHFYGALVDNSELFLQKGFLSKKSHAALQTYILEKKNEWRNLNHYSQMKVVAQETLELTNKISQLLGDLKLLVELLDKISTAIPQLPRISTDSFRDILVNCIIYSELDTKDNEDVRHVLSQFTLENPSTSTDLHKIIEKVIPKAARLILDEYKRNPDHKKNILYRILTNYNPPSQSVELRKTCPDYRNLPVRIPAGALSDSVALLCSSVEAKKSLKDLDLKESSFHLNLVKPIFSDNGVMAYAKTAKRDKGLFKQISYIEKMNWDLSNIFGKNHLFAPTCLLQFTLRHKEQRGAEKVKKPQEFHGTIQLAHKGKLLVDYLLQPLEKRTPIDMPYLIEVFITTIIFGTVDAHIRNVSGFEPFSSKPKLFDNGRNLAHSNRMISIGHELMAPYRCGLLFLPECFKPLTAEELELVLNEFTRGEQKYADVLKYFHFKLTERMLKTLKPAMFNLSWVIEALDERIVKGIEACKTKKIKTLRDVVFEVFPYSRFLALLSLTGINGSFDYTSDETLIERLIKDQNPTRYHDIQPLLLGNMGARKVEKQIHECALGVTKDKISVNPEKIYAIAKMHDVYSFEEMIRLVEEYYLEEKKEQGTLKKLEIRQKAYEPWAEYLALKLHSEATLDLKETGEEDLYWAPLEHILTDCKFHKIDVIRNDSINLATLIKKHEKTPEKVILAITTVEPKYIPKRKRNEQKETSKNLNAKKPQLTLHVYYKDKGTSCTYPLDCYGYPGKVTFGPSGQYIMAVGELKKHFCD